jgi:acylpyruvate hydrolase
MRLVTFKHKEQIRHGVRINDRVVDLSVAAPSLPQSILGILQGGTEALQAAAAAARCAGVEPSVDLDAIEYLPPVLFPGKIVCLGTNYASLVSQLGLDWPAQPFVFLRTSTSLTPHRGPILVPASSTKLDYEIELAVIIGRRARQVTPAEALRCIAGYSIFNDVTVRDYQGAVPIHTVSKNFDATGPFGPELVTADELPPGGDGLRLTTKINKAKLQDGNTSDMIFKVGNALSYLASRMTLEPGDVITTGTPPGVGSTLTPPIWLRPGDLCEMEIEGIGLLSNPVIKQALPSV